MCVSEYTAKDTQSDEHVFLLFQWFQEGSGIHFLQRKGISFCGAKPCIKIYERECNMRDKLGISSVLQWRP